MSLVNFYEHIDKKYLNQTHINPHAHVCQHPVRVACVGASGAGKSNSFMNLLKNMVFDGGIYMVAPCQDQPLYKYLKDNFNKYTPSCKLFESVDGLPTIEEIVQQSGGKQVAVCFDDVVTEKRSTQDKIAVFFARGRNANISCIYLTQVYFGMVKAVRLNLDFLMIRKIESDDDLSRIIKENFKGVDKAVAKKMYEAATESDDITRFLTIDKQTTDLNKRYRVGFQFAFRVKPVPEPEPEPKLLVDNEEQ